MAFHAVLIPPSFANSKDAQSALTWKQAERLQECRVCAMHADGMASWYSEIVNNTHTHTRLHRKTHTYAHTFAQKLRTVTVAIHTFAGQAIRVRGGICKIFLL